MKRPRSMAPTPSTEGVEESTDPNVPQHSDELFKVCSTGERQIINGHVLDKGTVIELTEAEIEQQRAGGVALEDVHAEDNREVYSVREMYVSKDSEAE